MESLINMKFNSNGGGNTIELDDDTLTKLVLEANVIKSRWLKADTTLSQQWFLKNIEVKDGKDNGSRELDIFKSLQKIEIIIQKMNLHDRERVKLFFECLLSV
jgi:hypothetical protein